MQGRGELDVFRKLEQKKRSAHVVDEILRAVTTGRYDVGDKLPSEQEIADLTGVSRPCVREALGVLRYVGILDTRVGDGTYVRAMPSGANSAGAEASIREILEQSENPFEALEARRVLESTAAAYAAERRTDKDLAELEGVLAELIDCSNRGDIDNLLQADQNFHSIVGRATRNPLLDQMLGWLLGLLEEGMWPHLKSRLLTESERHMQETRNSHTELFQAIRDQDASAARAIMDRHFDEIDRLVQVGE
jgi:GntR family transcriptional repressor for pyruvate dehydrogenase complex